MLKLCNMKKNEPGIENFINEVATRYKKAKKLLWLKKKKNQEAKIQSIEHTILQLIEESNENKDQSISKEVAEFFKRESQDHDISEIPDYFLCKINYVL